MRKKVSDSVGFCGIPTKKIGMLKVKAGILLEFCKGFQQDSKPQVGFYWDSNATSHYFTVKKASGEDFCEFYSKGLPSRYQNCAFEVHFSCKAFHVLQREKCLGFFSCHWFICLLSGIPTVQKRSFQSIELSLNFRIKKKLLFFLKTTVKQR